MLYLILIHNLTLVCAELHFLNVGGFKHMRHFFYFRIYYFSSSWRYDILVLWTANLSECSISS